MTNVEQAGVERCAPVFLVLPLEYMIDAGQRSVLFMDVMRQRGNQYREHMAETVPHVLDYAAELVIDGRTLTAAGELPPGAHRSAQGR